MQRGRKRWWAAIGAAFLPVADAIVQTIPDLAAGAGAGALKAVMDGNFDIQTIAAKAAIGAAAGAAIKWRLDKSQHPDDPPCDWTDGGER
jgi:hypothetical protein